jgi:hypothetical protein
MVAVDRYKERELHFVVWIAAPVSACTAAKHMAEAHKMGVWPLTDTCKQVKKAPCYAMPCMSATGKFPHSGLTQLALCDNTVSCCCAQARRNLPYQP